MCWRSVNLPVRARTDLTTAAVCNPPYLILQHFISPASEGSAECKTLVIWNSSQIKASRAHLGGGGTAVSQSMERSTLLTTLQPFRPADHMTTPDPSFPSVNMNKTQNHFSYCFEELPIVHPY